MAFDEAQAATHRHVCGIVQHYGAIRVLLRKSVVKRVAFNVADRMGDGRRDEHENYAQLDLPVWTLLPRSFLVEV